jgi:ribonuclease J
MDIHTSGHGCQEDLKLMMSLVKPKYLVPIHGEYYMRQAHGDLGKSMGMRDDQIVLIENGNVLEVSNGEMRISEEVVDTNYILVDGEGVGDIASTVIKERQAMSKNGFVMVLLKINKKTRAISPEIQLVSKGFIYQTETKRINQELIHETKEAIERLRAKDSEFSNVDLQRFVCGRLDNYIHKKLARQPLIITQIIED